MVLDREEMILRLKAGENPFDLSIEKWRGILGSFLEKVDREEKIEFRREEYDGTNCALCYEVGYRTKEEEQQTGESKADCFRCPIGKHTGKANCRRTPYDDFKSALWFGGKRDIGNTIYMELTFLEMIKDKYYQTDKSKRKRRLTKNEKKLKKLLKRLGI